MCRCMCPCVTGGPRELVRGRTWDGGVACVGSYEVGGGCGDENFSSVMV